MIGREYHKIQTVWLRDPATSFKTLLSGQWAKPEFEYLAHSDWLMTEKVDGTNVRIGIRTADSGANEIRGKSDNASMHPHLSRRCEEIAALASAHTLTGLTLYGEGFGAGIQKGGGNYSPNKDFVLFDVWAPADEMWLERANVEDIAAQLGIAVVPIVDCDTLYAAIGHCKDLDFLSRWPDVVPEGLVARPKVELRNRRGERIITKIKHKDFSVDDAN